MTHLLLQIIIPFKFLALLPNNIQLYTFNNTGTICEYVFYILIVHGPKSQTFMILQISNQICKIHIRILVLFYYFWF